MVVRFVLMIVAAAALVMLVPSSASAEPISSAIALSIYIFGQGAISVGVAMYAGTIITSLITGIALSAASTLLSRALSQQDKGGGQPSLAAQQNSLRIGQRGGIASRQMTVGLVWKSGHIVFEETKGPFLYRCYVVDAGRIDGVAGVRMNGRDVAVDANGFPTEAPYFQNGKYYFQVSVRLGEDDQTIDPVLAADWPTLERSFRQQGLACVVVKFFRGETAAEAEEILFFVRGRRFYDPRNSTHVLGNASTYTHTRNAALIRAGWDHDAEGQAMPWGDEDIEALKAAADVCDQVVARGDDAFEPRYQCDGVIDTSADPARTLQDLTLTMLGTFVASADKVAYLAGVAREPEFTLSEDSARGDLDASSGRSWDDVINTVRTSFVAANDDYRVTDGPVYQDLAALAEDGEEKSITVELPFVVSETQVMRICKHLIARSRLGMSFTRSEDITALERQPGDIGRLEYTGALSALNGNIEIIRIRDTERLDEFEISGQQYDGAALYGWNPDIDKQGWSSMAEAA